LGRRDGSGGMETVGKNRRVSGGRKGRRREGVEDG